jgi:hypothetical protein
VARAEVPGSDSQRRHRIDVENCRVAPTVEKALFPAGADELERDCGDRVVGSVWVVVDAMACDGPTNEDAGTDGAEPA